MSQRLVLQVDHGDGAIGSIPNPAAYHDGGLEWHLRYHADRNAVLCAASVVETFDYLISGLIPMTEVTRRMRQFRDAYRAAKERGR